jgi:hypothetical protein
MRRIMMLATAALVIVFAASAVATAAQEHAKSNLEPVGGSGVHGTVHLSQLSSGARASSSRRGV